MFKIISIKQTGLSKKKVINKRNLRVYTLTYFRPEQDANKIYTEVTLPPNADGNIKKITIPLRVAIYTQKDYSDQDKTKKAARGEKGPTKLTDPTLKSASILRGKEFPSQGSLNRIRYADQGFLVKTPLPYNHSHPKKPQRTPDYIFYRLNEIKVMMQLAHTGRVPEIRSVGMAEDKHGNVKLYTEIGLCQGGDLLNSAYIVLSSPLERASIIWEFLRQMLELLCVCQDFGVVHRDIKPENVFLKTCPNIDPISGNASQPDNQEFVLGDWEMCCNLSEPDGKRCGSADYASPEVAKCGLSASSDIWSLGITAVTLLISKMPLELLISYPSGVTENEAERRIASQKVKMLRNPPTLTKGIGAIMDKLKSLKYDQDIIEFIGQMLTINSTERPTAKDLLKVPGT